MNFPAIEIKNLSFSYNKEFFFKNINIKICEKSFIGIIGPNGSGKTTFCKLILGLLKPISGEILYFNNFLQNFSEIGYVSQNTNVKDFPLTVKELILLGSVDKKSSFNYFSKNIKRRADNLIQELGLEKIQNFPLTKLSGGQIQLTLIAKALIKNPKILILDEPTSHLDQTAQKIILKILSKIKKDTTILLVGHDLNTIIKHVDKMLLIDKTIKMLSLDEICEHFALGLYHHPLINSKHPHKHD